MSLTDVFNLNSSPMFEKIRGNLPLERQKIQHIMESKGDLLYVWDAAESCVHVMDWRYYDPKNANENKYQTLVPSIPQDFKVERLHISRSGISMALAGPKGVAIMELPLRYGKSGQYMNGKEKITCG
ncbi:nuclear pore complex protein Nup88-like [Teleopsis dalmanni]|uniref:nuclear pore complex protein Nup88-like n=1 Tax=Teleopsis dalmanni TaxID=139649 RepID=UPI0018CCF030|nr:nuclear pore complex protein Nup88-like [Teleopsis dalmanni]